MDAGQCDQLTNRLRGAGGVTASVRSAWRTRDTSSSRLNLSRVCPPDVTGDPAIALIAAGQHGVVTRAQLLSAGLTHSAINHRLARKRLHPLHRGVYLVGHPVPPPLAIEVAAVLACGNGAVVSHDWAGAISGNPVPDERPDRHHRTQPQYALAARHPRAQNSAARPLRHPHTAMASHSPPRPARCSIWPTSSPSRELQRAVRASADLAACAADELRAIVERSRVSAVLAALRSLLAAEPALTRSEAEARLLAAPARRGDRARAATNTRVARHEVDFLWRRQRLIVEVDGFTYHASRAAFERDRLRDAELHAAGYRVMRVTWQQIEGPAPRRSSPGWRERSRGARSPRPRASGACACAPRSSGGSGRAPRVACS